MLTIAIDLKWWPPAPDEPLGVARARELAHRLREVARPVVEEAEQDLRGRLDPRTDIVRSRAPLGYLAQFAFDDPQMQSLCVGVVHQANGNPPAMNSVQLGRDGVLRWRRE